MARDILITRFLGKTGNGIILTIYLVRHFQVDDFRLLNFVNHSFLAGDIEIIRFLGETGNGIVFTGNRIILTL